MSDVIPGQEPTTAEAVQVTAEQTAPVAAQPETDKQGIDSLPEWARTLINDTRKEAAKHRTAAKQAEDAAKAKELAEAQQRGEFEKIAQTYKSELDAVRAEAEALKLNALRATVGHQVGLPPALIDRLKGTTEDELKADALELLKIMPRPAMATDASNGISGGKTPASRWATDADRIEEANRLGQNPKYYGLT